MVTSATPVTSPISFAVFFTSEAYFKSLVSFFVLQAVTYIWTTAIWVPVVQFKKNTCPVLHKKRQKWLRNSNDAVSFRMFQTLDQFSTRGLQKFICHFGLILKLRDLECARPFCFEKKFKKS